jgi:hypothetical protein
MVQFKSVSNLSILRPICRRLFCWLVTIYSSEDILKPIAVADWSETRNILRLLKHWDRGFESYSSHGCLFILCMCCPMWVATLRWAAPPSKEPYKLSVRFVILELILSSNRSESLIRQGGARRIFFKIVILPNRKRLEVQKVCTGLSAIRFWDAQGNLSSECRNWSSLLSKMVPKSSLSSDKVSRAWSSFPCIPVKPIICSAFSYLLCRTFRV